MEELTPWLSLEMKADKTAKINIFGYIGIPENWQHDETMAKQVVSTKEKMRVELDKLSNLKADNIEVNIDSFGGDVNHGLAIYNALAFNKANITVNYVGWSASIATVIGAAGNVVNAPDNFMGLLHEARGGAYGPKNKVEAFTKYLDSVNSVASKIYAKKSASTPEAMFSIMQENNGEGYWKNADELKEIGLIDNVLEPMKAAASFDEMIERAKKYNINSNINMGLFSKGTKQVNQLIVGEVTAVYEGELQEGVKLAGIGAEITDEIVEFEGNKITIENSIVKSIEALEPEMVAASDVEAKITAATTDMQVKLDTANDSLTQMTTEKDKYKGLYENLASLSSSHKPKSKEGVDNGVEGDLELQIRNEVKGITKENAEAQIEKRKKGVLA